MKVTVKIVRGAECTVEVQPDFQVNQLKRLIENDLKIPFVRQKLLLKGRLLLDWRRLEEYDIRDGCKLNLVVLDIIEPIPQTSFTIRGDALQKEMTVFMRRYFNDIEASKIVDEFMKEFYISTGNCNLDDWERVAIGYLEEDRAK